MPGLLQSLCDSRYKESKKIGTSTRNKYWTKL